MISITNTEKEIVTFLYEKMVNHDNEPIPFGDFIIYITFNINKCTFYFLHKGNCIYPSLSDNFILYSWSDKFTRKESSGTTYLYKANDLDIYLVAQIIIDLLHYEESILFV